MNNLENRLLKHTYKTANCWFWIGAGLPRHGVLNVDGKMVGAHRLFYQLQNGPIPEKLLVLHRCDIPQCVNPEHLFVGTDADNLRDAYAKGRLFPIGEWNSAKTHCPHGHEYTPENTGYTGRKRYCRICKR